MSVVKTAQLHPQAAINQTSCLFDDFYNYTTANLWTTVTGSAGTTAASGTSGADKVLFTTAATNNDVQGLRSTNTNFLMASGIGMYAETYMTFANQASANANIFFGFASTTSLSTTDGSDPSASYSGALIYKVDGGSVWKVQTSNGSTKTTSTSTASAVDGNYLLRIDIVNWDGLNALATFSVNGQQLRDSNGIAICHQVAYSGLAAMYVIALAQAGSSNVQTASHDYITAGKFRNISF